VFHRFTYNGSRNQRIGWKPNVQAHFGGVFNGQIKPQQPVYSATFAVHMNFVELPLSGRDSPSLPYS
jgi:hypothetical protein